MRTTVTLDDDVSDKLQDRMRRTGVTFREALNTCLRRGLEATADKELAAPFTVEGRSMGLRPGIDLDDIGGLLDLLDGPARP
ncbi:MAG: hypothetical protein OXN89_10065 [Bryobacterales bacterium]|nr:hypothetical protein [Bryobacterales bacterium]